jgi:hypothetical protein
MLAWLKEPLHKPLQKRGKKQKKNKSSKILQKPLKTTIADYLSV